MPDQGATKCRSCGALIVMRTHERTGKTAPIDAFAEGKMDEEGQDTDRSFDVIQRKVIDDWIRVQPPMTAGEETRTRQRIEDAVREGRNAMLTREQRHQLSAVSTRDVGGMHDGE